MTVIVANDVPPSVRGHLKRWFIEPRPNVFVGTLNGKREGKVLDFVLRHAHSQFGMLIITSAPNCQGYEIRRIGPEGKTGRKDVNLSGIPLIAEEWIDPDRLPF